MPPRNCFSLREELLDHLRGGRAHVTFEKAVAGLPFSLMGKKPQRLPYSPWQLLEHIRITQWDIIGYTMNPKHLSPNWPQGYWPKNPAPSSLASWKQSVRNYHRDLKRFSDFIRNPKLNLLVSLAHDRETTVLHMSILLVDHTTYHLGQLVVLRRLLNAWREK